jgi:hypothetical protein
VQYSSWPSGVIQLIPTMIAGGCDLSAGIQEAGVKNVQI